jgi:hypothetical protein
MHHRHPLDRHSLGGGVSTTTTWRRDSTVAWRRGLDRCDLEEGLGVQSENCGVMLLKFCLDPN